MNMNIRLTNINIWKDENILFIKRADDNLLQIKGKDIINIEKIISFFRDNPNCNIEKASEELKENINFDKENFNNAIEWLTNNGILEISDDNTLSKEIKIAYKIDSDKLKEHFISNMDLFSCNNTHLIELDGNLNSKIDLILIISPLFDNYNEIKEISEKTYKNDIPLLHFELSPNSITIGPLVIPERGTPSLSCYIKRKIVNSKDAKKLVNFIKSTNKNRINKLDPTIFPFFKLFCEIIKIELEKYFKYEGAFSEHLIGKTILIDFVNYDIEKSIILKDPQSPIFKKEIYSPFNG